MTPSAPTADALNEAASRDIHRLLQRDAPKDLDRAKDAAWLVDNTLVLTLIPVLFTLGATFIALWTGNTHLAPFGLGAVAVLMVSGVLFLPAAEARLHRRTREVQSFAQEAYGMDALTITVSSNGVLTQSPVRLEDLHREMTEARALLG